MSVRSWVSCALIELKLAATRAGALEELRARRRVFGMVRDVVEARPEVGELLRRCPLSDGSLNSCSMRDMVDAADIEIRHRAVFERGADLEERIAKARDVVDLDAAAVAVELRPQRGHRRCADAHEVDALARVALGVRVRDVLGRDLESALLRFAAPSARGGDPRSRT